MANTVPLNNVDHKDLRIDTRRGAALGDAVMSALTFPAEFRSVQAHYPIVFRKAADGGFQPVALFGFSDGENLFLDGERWDASYLPLAVERQPFLIGAGHDELVVHVDMDSPRVGTVAGDAVFLEHGGTTQYLERASSVLRALHEGIMDTPAFMRALLDAGLLESFAMDVELDDGARHRLAGYYVINEERLAALDGEALERLHRAGHLQPVYMALASLVNLRALIDRTNRARAAGR